MSKRLGLWAFVATGIAVVIWAGVSLASPNVVCHGVAMGPGDTCEQLDFSGERSGKVRTYEELRANAAGQAPFAVAAGLGMAGFGLVVMRRDQRSAA